MCPLRRAHSVPASGKRYWRRRRRQRRPGGGRPDAPLMHDDAEPGTAMDQTEKKRQAARAALDHIQMGTALGVGTGSTVNELIELLPEVTDRLTSVVSSSSETTRRLQARDIEVSELNSVGDLDLYVDGADEI